MTLLAGARVALLEARLVNEMADLVRREGGEPVCAPAVEEARVDVTGIIPVLIDDIHRERITLVVFLTGSGVSSLFTQAEATGNFAQLVAALSKVTTVCRGPKPAAVLRRYDVPARIGVRPPHTTAELLDALAALPMAGRGVVVLSDGGSSPTLARALSAAGARVQEIRSYEWRLPANVAPIEQVILALIDDRIDAVAFTTQVQVRHLFEIAVRMNLRDALLHALRERTIVGSIGPTCSGVLEEFGVAPHVVASPPRMRPLVIALGARLAARQHVTGQVNTP